jgi:hypothetical protein
MAFSDEAKNTMLDGFTAFNVSLHVFDPGTTGLGEVTGGSPAYARQLATFDAATRGTRLMTGDETFNVPISTTITHFGVWDNAATPSFIGGGSLPSQSFVSQGTYILPAGDTSLDLAPVTLSYEEEVLLDSPLGLWMLDETSGTVATDQGSVGENGDYGTTYSPVLATRTVFGLTSPDFQTTDNCLVSANVGFDAGHIGASGTYTR